MENCEKINNQIQMLENLKKLPGNVTLQLQKQSMLLTQQLESINKVIKDYQNILDGITNTEIKNDISKCIEFEKSHLKEIESNYNKIQIEIKNFEFKRINQIDMEIKELKKESNSSTNSLTDSPQISWVSSSNEELYPIGYNINNYLFKIIQSDFKHSIYNSYLDTNNKLMPIKIKNYNTTYYLNPNDVSSISNDIYIEAKGINISTAKKVYYFNVYNGDRKKEKFDKTSITIQCNNISEADELFVNIFNLSTNPELYKQDNIVFSKYLFRHFLREYYKSQLVDIFKYYDNFSNAIADLSIIVKKCNLDKTNWTKIIEIRNYIDFLVYISEYDFQNEIIFDKNIENIKVNYAIYIEFKYNGSQYSLEVNENTLNNLKKMSKLKNLKTNKTNLPDGTVLITPTKTDLLKSYYEFITENKMERFYKFLPNNFCMQN